MLDCSGVADIANLLDAWVTTTVGVPEPYLCAEASTQRSAVLDDEGAQACVDQLYRFAAEAGLVDCP